MFFHVYPANVHESKIYPLILEMLKRKRLIGLECHNHRRILRLQEVPNRDKVRCSAFDHSEEEFQVGDNFQCPKMFTDIKTAEAFLATKRI